MSDPGTAGPSTRGEASGGAEAALVAAGVAPEHRGAILRLASSDPGALGAVLEDHGHWRLYLRSRTGDARAAAAFEKHWSGNVARFCGARFRQDQAEEIASVFFERVYRLVQDDFRWQCSFSAYLRVILLNVSRDVLRRLIVRREREHGLEAAESASSAAPDGPERRALQGERDASVRRALGRLAPADRHLVVRTLVEGESGDDLAAELGISRDAVYQRVSRARRRLRQLLKDLS